jgi:hypothetical protein
MEVHNQLKVNTPNVVHETIDGETILLDLNTGNYYSLDGSGALIWEFIDKTGNYEKAIEILTAANSAESDNIAGAVKKFADELLTEKLMVIASSEITPADVTEIENKLKEMALNFKAPAVCKYTDMQDLLLLDPIHEVDEKGWPESKETQVNE